MINRFKKAFYALLIVLLITLGCLAFMPWPVNEVIPELKDVQGCILARYDGEHHTITYPKDDELDHLLEVLGPATGHFDRKRPDIHHEGNAPLYRIYFRDSYGNLPEVWVCGTQFFYNNSQYVLNEQDALAVSRALAECFDGG